MKKVTLLILVLAVVLSAPAMAGRIQSTMITHFNQVYQVAVATSTDTLSWAGYDQTARVQVITAAPGILNITPGTNWRNFIGAYHTSSDNPWPTSMTDPVIKNITFTKDCPDFTQCHGIFPSGTVTQQGTPNIRLWWPLMYEVPSCEFTLTILYGTNALWDDDGPSGPNPAAWVHVEQWVWHVDTDIVRLSQLLELFHEVPFGKDEVPLISDESLYTALWNKLMGADGANDAYQAGDYAAAAAALQDFELEVMDACIGTSPTFPNPGGPFTGIAQTLENPACCKLLVDVEYILQTTGIGQPKKK
jgi:hypothetical protein